VCQGLAHSGLDLGVFFDAFDCGLDRLLGVGVSCFLSLGLILLLLRSFLLGLLLGFGRLGLCGFGSLLFGWLLIFRLGVL
jgi:hypothetical protein